KASQCKQHIDRQNGLELLALVNQFAEAFWTTKGLKTYTAQCPYPPAQAVVYPVLDNA
ncbi:superoxide dismutase [Ni], partial [Neptunomonas phycophila]|uniref:superoxide dismutase [Ni] n=2 Tax=Neptunomonas TaxID=75687 RepID=UPI003517D32B